MSYGINHQVGIKASPEEVHRGIDSDAFREMNTAVK